MKKAAIAAIVLLCLAAGVWWFLADEALEPATQAWLDAPRADQAAEGLDFLLFMGSMAPAGADPIEYARGLISLKEADFKFLVNYPPDIMQDAPCAIKDWVCWEIDDSTWVAHTLSNHAHVLERWQSLPVHNDFGDQPLRWVLSLVAPALDSRDHLMKIQLIDAHRRDNLNELASQALDHAAKMALARPRDGNALSLLLFEITRQQSINQVMKAIRLGASPPVRETLDQFLSGQLLVDDQLTASAYHDFDRLRNALPYIHRYFPGTLLARENRTLNRVRACLENVIELADPARLLEFLKAEEKICGPEWRSWRNWRADEIIEMQLYGSGLSACRIITRSLHDTLVEASLSVLTTQDSDDLRLAQIARANPFYPERGALLKGDRVCFESLAPACVEACLPAPWPVTSSLE